jgi:flagellar motor switch protein FliN
MNETATKTLLDGFLVGGFDVFGALLSVSFSHTAGGSSILDADSLGPIIDTHSVAFQAQILGGGTATYLYSMEDITKIVSLTNTGESTVSDSTDEASMGTVKEIADGVLGGGVANLTKKFGEDVEIENFDVKVYTSEQVGELLEYVGEGPVITSFTFSADPEFDSTGHFIVSAALEARVPSGGDDPLVSDDEMKDILSGFTPGDETGEYSGTNDPVPENLDVILGIDLTATARLGKVEMPISELLNIGPGSIIEVGQLVDDPVELLVNGRLIARGDVVVVDEKFGLRVTEIISPRERIESLR